MTMKRSCPVLMKSQREEASALQSHSRSMAAHRYAGLLLILASFTAAGHTGGRRAMYVPPEKSGRAFYNSGLYTGLSAFLPAGAFGYGGLTACRAGIALGRCLWYTVAA